MLTALGGVILAVATLVGALSAAGIIGGNGGTSPTTSPSGAEGALDDAIVQGRWRAELQVSSVEHPELIEGGLWGIFTPQQGDLLTETWKMESICPDSPCDVTWESVETPNRFQTLKRDGRFYSGIDPGQARCGAGSASVTRRLELQVTEGSIIDEVWSARELQGDLVVTWSCEGTFIRGILDVNAIRLD